MKSGTEASEIFFLHQEVRCRALCYGRSHLFSFDFLAYLFGMGGSQATSNSGSCWKFSIIFFHSWDRWMFSFMINCVRFSCRSRITKVGDLEIVHEPSGSQLILMGSIFFFWPPPISPLLSALLQAQHQMQN